MILKIGNRETRFVRTMKHAVSIYRRLRDDSGEGGSTFPDGKLITRAKTYTLSYNAKVWDGEILVYNPYA